MLPRRDTGRLSDRYSCDVYIEGGNGRCSSFTSMGPVAGYSSTAHGSLVQVNSLACMLVANLSAGRRLESLRLEVRGVCVIVRVHEPSSYSR